MNRCFEVSSEREWEREIKRKRKLSREYRGRIVVETPKRWRLDTTWKLLNGKTIKKIRGLARCLCFCFEPEELGGRWSSRQMAWKGTMILSTFCAMASRLSATVGTWLLGRTKMLPSRGVALQKLSRRSS